MINERLDEAIDRVAAELTAGAADATFTARLQSRLDAPSSSHRLWLAVPAAVALVGLVGISIALRTTQPEVQHDAAAVVAPPIASPRTPDAAPARAVPEPRITAQHAPRHADRAVVEPSESAIVALTTPEKLIVEDLSVDSLTVAPVELRVLDLAHLEVPGLDASGEPKEPQ